MSGFIITLLLSAIAGMGDRPQLLAALLAMRHGASTGLIAGAVLASAINAAVSAVAGAWIGAMMTDSPRILLLGMALGFAAAGMVGARMINKARPIDRLEGWRTGPFITSILGLGILQAGDKSQFLIFAVAALTATAPAAAVGGTIGAMVPLGIAIILGERTGQIIPLKQIRFWLGWLLLPAAIFCAMKALRFIS